MQHKNGERPINTGEKGEKDREQRRDMRSNSRKEGTEGRKELRSEPKDLFRATA